jgi:hypothetical protein
MFPTNPLDGATGALKRIPTLKSSPISTEHAGYTPYTNVSVSNAPLVAAAGSAAAAAKLRAGVVFEVELLVILHVKDALLAEPITRYRMCRKGLFRRLLWHCMPFVQVHAGIATCFSHARSLSILTYIASPRSY